MGQGRRMRAVDNDIILPLIRYERRLGDIGLPSLSLGGGAKLLAPIQPAAPCVDVGTARADTDTRSLDSERESEAGL